jgi:HAD superfamily hydrolase (TIGR01509 family)
VIFDVDGTLAETERDGHRPAFNRAFADHGLPYTWSVAEYARLLATTGGRERLRGYLLEQGHEDDADGLAASLHRTKTAHLVEWIRTGPVQSRPGVRELMAESSAAGLILAIATTGRRAWVLPLLDRLLPGVRFAAIVTGDDVERLKPDPAAYLLALDRIGVPAEQAVAIEDSPPGLAAARAAGLACLVVTSEYTGAARFPGAAAVVPAYLPSQPRVEVAGPSPHLDQGVRVSSLRELLAAVTDRGALA